MDTIHKIQMILNHIENVQRNCNKIGIRLIELGNTALGIKIIANGQIHDNSKFRGVELEHLFEGDPLLIDAVKHHNSTNPHHPEYWAGSIHNMPEEFIVEFVADTAARSSEFGTDIRAWLNEVATKKYDFKMEDTVGKKITYYLQVLLSRPFKQIETKLEKA